LKCTRRPAACPGQDPFDLGMGIPYHAPSRRPPIRFEKACVRRPCATPRPPYRLVPPPASRAPPLTARRTRPPYYSQAALSGVDQKSSMPETGDQIPCLGSKGMASPPNSLLARRVLTPVDHPFPVPNPSYPIPKIPPPLAKPGLFISRRASGPPFHYSPRPAGGQEFFFLFRPALKPRGWKHCRCRPPPWRLGSWCFPPRPRKPDGRRLVPPISTPPFPLFIAECVSPTAVFFFSLPAQKSQNLWISSPSPDTRP